MPNDPRTQVRNIPRGEEVHTDDPFGGNLNNRKAHENRLKIAAAVNAPAAPLKGAELAAQIRKEAEAAEAAKAAVQAPSFNASKQ